MTFRDPKLQQHCERTAAVAKDFPSEQVSVISLLDAWYWFHLAEGQDSPRAAEAIELLLSPELRPALRQWYRDAGDTMNENALQFRDQLSQLAGERFG